MTSLATWLQAYLLPTLLAAIVVELLIQFALVPLAKKVAIRVSSRFKQRMTEIEKKRIREITELSRDQTYLLITNGAASVRIITGFVLGAGGILSMGISSILMQYSLIAAVLYGIVALLCSFMGIYFIFSGMSISICVSLAAQMASNRSGRRKPPRHPQTGR